MPGINLFMRYFVQSTAQNYLKSRFAAKLIKVKYSSQALSPLMILCSQLHKKIITGLSAGYYYSKSALKYKISNEF